MVEWVVVKVDYIVVLVDDVDDIMAVVIVNLGMFLWVVFIECVYFKKGEMVLINGVIGVFGWLVIQIVKYLGVLCIVVIGCNLVYELELLLLGVDVFIFFVL